MEPPFPYYSHAVYICTLYIPILPILLPITRILPKILTLSSKEIRIAECTQKYGDITKKCGSSRKICVLLLPLKVWFTSENSDFIILHQQTCRFDQQKESLPIIDGGLTNKNADWNVKLTFNHQKWRVDHLITENVYIYMRMRVPSLGSPYKISWATTAWSLYSTAQGSQRKSKHIQTHTFPESH